MVWVSNQASNDITVKITKLSGGGSDAEFVLHPKTNETHKKNLWIRKGDELITITYSNKTTKEFFVDKDDFVTVYDDAAVRKHNSVVDKIADKIA